MASKDISTKSKALEEDEIIYEEDLQGAKNPGAVPFSIEDIFNKYRTWVLAGVGLIAVVVIGSFVYSSMQAGKNKEAQENMIQAVNYFEMDSLQLAIAGDGQNAGLESIVEDYGGTQAGNTARAYLGMAYLQTGNIAKAIETLEDFRASDNVGSSVVLSALAAAYEENGDIEKAARTFEEAAATPDRNSHMTPFFLKEAARNYEAAGKKEKALDLYREIRKKYPTSDEGQQIMKYIARLSPDVDE